jgi:hypothetical protein
MGSGETMTKEKKNSHGGIRERTDISELQKALAEECRDTLGFPDCFWWGVPGRPVNRLYLTREYGIATYLDFVRGVELWHPTFGTANVRDEEQRKALAWKMLPAFRAALVLGPEGIQALEALDREAASVRPEHTNQ